MANKMTGNNPNQNPSNEPNVETEKLATEKALAEKGFYIITSTNGQPFTMKKDGRSFKEKMFKIKADKTEEIKKLKANGFLIVKKVK